jgi:hypothetical protein
MASLATDSTLAVKVDKTSAQFLVRPAKACFVEGESPSSLAGQTPELRNKRT